MYGLVVCELVKRSNGGQDRRLPCRFHDSSSSPRTELAGSDQLGVEERYLFFSEEAVSAQNIWLPNNSRLSDLLLATKHCVHPSGKDYRIFLGLNERWKYSLATLRIVQVLF